MTAVFTSLAASRSMSDVCRQYVIPAYCYITFPLCVVSNGHVTSDVRDRPQVRRLCKQDCLLLETNYCLTEYSAAGHSDSAGSYITRDQMSIKYRFSALRSRGNLYA